MEESAGWFPRWLTEKSDTTGTEHPTMQRSRMPRAWPRRFLAGLATFLLLATATSLHLPSSPTAPAAEARPATLGQAGPRAALLARLGVDRYHAAACQGQGIKVAVLDSGFRGYREHLGKALPARVAVRSFRAD